MKLTVLGPGCWGLTIAKLLNNNFDEICVWGRESDITPMLKNEKRIEKPLEIQLDKKVEILKLPISYPGYHCVLSRSLENSLFSLFRAICGRQSH